jgi:hypothetical protein
MTNKIRKAVVKLDGDLGNIWNPSHFSDDNYLYLLLDTDDGVYFLSKSKVPIFSSFRYICTKSELKQEVIKWKQEQFLGGNMEFTKDMLISGEHIVECKDGVRLLVAGSVLIGVRGFTHLSSYNEDLSHAYAKGQENFSIQKVMSYKDIFCSGFRQSFVNGITSAHKLPTVWERKEKSSQQLEIEELQKVIADAKQKIDKLAGANK